MTDDIWKRREQRLVDAVKKAVADLMNHEGGDAAQMKIPIDATKRIWVMVGPMVDPGSDIRPDEPLDVCCDHWAKAQQPGTSAQAEQSTATALWQTQGEWKMGSFLPPITFCPWCGKQHPMRPHEVRRTLDTHPSVTICAACGEQIPDGK